MVMQIINWLYLFKCSFLRHEFLNFTLLSMLFISTNALALTAMVDRNTVAINESVRLEIITNDNSKLNKIDLSDIEKYFAISNTSRQSHSSIINGRSERQNKLVLTLLPKTIGKTAIPALHLNKQHTQPITIIVTKAKRLPQQLADQSVLVEAEINTNNAVIGEQLIYTFRLLYRVALNGAEITPLEIPNADISPLKDSTYQRRSASYNYHVVEKRYAVHFKKPGIHQWTPQTLTASLNNQRRSRFSLDPFAQGEQIKLSAKTLSVNINDIPQGVNVSTWLPAHHLEIHQSWSKDVASIPIGEPVSRTITINAKGLTAEQIPSFSYENIDGLNIYPEKPEFVNQEWVNGIAGQRTNTLVYVPTQAGRYTLPKIEINWWNTQTNRIETASLLEQTFIVINTGASQVNNNSVANNLSQVTDDLSSQENPNLNTEQSSSNHMQLGSSQQASTQSSPIWFWTTIGCLIGWLLTLIIWLVRVNQNKHAVTITENNKSQGGKLKLAKATLTKACKTNQATAAKAALNHWLAIQQSFAAQKSPQNINVATPLLSVELNQAIIELNAALYAPQNEANWNGRKMLDAINSFNDSINNRNRKTTEMPQLYPT